MPLHKPLIVVRHSASDFNYAAQARREADQLRSARLDDSMLTPVGRDQARRLGEQLATSQFSTPDSRQR